MIKFYTYNTKSNFNNYLWNGVLQTSCKVVTALQGCEHLNCMKFNDLVMTLLQPYKVAARLLQPISFHMEIKFNK